MKIASTEEMLNMLEKLVNIDSGSYHKDGVDRVGQQLIDAYQTIGFHADIHEQHTYGNHIVLMHHEATEPDILVVAHMDTVFLEGTAAERPFHIVGERAYGPGVIDMKASHVTTFSALQALLNANKEAAKNVVVLLTSDEEIGAPSARKLIEAQGAGKKAVLVMEPARKDGSLVTSRRGGGRYTLKVTGKAAHSGIEPEKGRSAIEELAHKTIKLHQLSNHEEGISVNVGISKGGTSINTVADYAEGKVDIRITTQDQAAPLAKAIENICAQPDVPDTSIELEGEITRPPMERNEQTIALYEIFKDVASSLNIDLTETSTGGGSDASFTSALGIPTIDGMGPIGGNQHNDEEYLEIDSLVERTKLLALTIERLSS